MYDYGAHETTQPRRSLPYDCTNSLSSHFGFDGDARTGLRDQPTPPMQFWYPSETLYCKEAR